MNWKYNGSNRPSFAEQVRPGRESVWDYPRPPIVVRDSRRVRVRFEGMEIADTTNALRILETAGAPGIYIPAEDVRNERLRASDMRTVCEWKGEAKYFDLLTRQGVMHNIAWSYPEPDARYAEIAGYLSFYPGRVECFIDAERVRAQAGGFYGGWVTSEIIGPIKGAPGTGWW